MIFPPRRFFFALLPLLFFSCSIFKKSEGSPRRKTKPRVAVATTPQRVGTITLVNQAEHFVLIDMGMAGVPPLGTALKTFTGEASSGVVAVGNVNRRPFLVADIVQGAPLKGDVVFQ